MSYWKRLYANPFKPWCCPVLALGVHVLCYTPADLFTNRVFTTTGDSFRDHFKKFMAKAFPGNKVEELPVHRITSHSAKRGGICMASGNEVVKWEAVELRADHKCGLTSTYQTCAAPQQDGIMGRLFAGLSFGKEEFNVAAPHFRPEDVLQIPFPEFVSHYESYSAPFKSVLPFLLASVVFHLHNGNLKRLLPKEHPFWASTFVMRHRPLLSQLGPKVMHHTPPHTTIHHHHNHLTLFIQVLGGKVGAESILPLTGNSVIGDIRADVTDIRADLKTLKRVLSTVSGSAGQSVVAGAVVSSIQFDALQQQLSTMQEDLIGVKRKLDQQSELVTFSSGRAEPMPRQCVPVFYLSNAFKIYSCQPFTLLTRWITPEPPAPAWRHIRNEMLPRTDGRRAQECLLTTYNGFMQAFMGRNPNISEVETNLQAYFAVAWDRMAVECGWDAGRVPSRSVKTVYGWLRERPTAMKKLQDSKLILPATFEIQMAVDARNAREAERFRALDVGHPPIHHQNHHHTPCSLHPSFRCRLNRVLAARLMSAIPPYTTIHHAHCTLLSGAASIEWWQRD